MVKAPSARIAGFALLLALLVALVGLVQLEFSSAVDRFLPTGADAPRVFWTRALSQASGSRAMAVVVEGPDDAAARSAAATLGARMSESPLFEWVRSGYDEGDESNFLEAFGERSLTLLPAPRAEPDALGERARELKARLAGNASALWARQAPSDPLGTFPRWLEAAEGLNGNLRMVEGQLMAATGSRALLFASTHARALDAPSQREVVEWMDAQISELPAGIDVRWTSVGRYTAKVEAASRGDGERVGAVATLAILLLYALCFRAPRPLVAGSLPIAVGTALALGGVQLVFGHVHVLTLAFGAALIGVAIDYVSHYLVHWIRRDDPSVTPREVATEIWPALAMGAATTIVGIAALVASGFPGLVQLAVFGVLGVGGALLATHAWVPTLAGPMTRAAWMRRVGGTQRVTEGSKSDSAGVHRGLLALVLGLTAVAAFGLTQLRWDDGLGALRVPTPGLEAEEAEVRAALGFSAASAPVVVASGEDDEAARRRNDAVAELFATTPPTADGEAATTLRSFSPIAPAAQTVRERLEAQREPAFRRAFESAFAAEGFAVEAFAPYWARLDAELESPTTDGLAEGPLAELLPRFRIEAPADEPDAPTAFGRVAYLSFPSAPLTPERVDALESIGGVWVVDAGTVLDEAYTRVRKRSLSMIGFGLLGVLAVLRLRARGWMAALRGMVPALFACVASLGLQGLFGLSANLMHLVGVLLVLSVGVDYGIYMLEAHGQGGRRTAGLSVILATATSLASFAALAFVENPALSAIGWTVGLGVPLAALASALVRPSPESPGA